ncbi:hypothetical protein [Neobacillus sp.]|uniref:hypothetical protein n=1 Tax=Neobacillus sp. TaxID=2675273 RepID=UPI00289EF492|nr:hypothetical protein [Neobacillus sp.]
MVYLKNYDGLTLVDATYGKEKTPWAIQLKNEANISEKFIYFTRFLTEVERVKESVTKKFHEQFNLLVLVNMNDTTEELQNDLKEFLQHDIFGGAIG